MKSLPRKILRGWSVRASAAALYPERHDGLGSGLDRRVAAGLGRVALSMSPLRRLFLRYFAAQVARAARELEQASETQLKDRLRELRRRLLAQGLTRRNVAESFALVSEASFRTLQKRHYPVQIMGGYELLRGKLAEMATGEGKTLTACLPAITVALCGVPVHVVTVNEYLAARDAADLGPLYRFFELSVGCTRPGEEPDARRGAYARDVTYCIDKDLVFDYLRDHLDRAAGPGMSWRTVASFLDGHSRPPQQLLQGLFFAIVDEADSIFIDEARTPLIIASEVENAHELDSWRAALGIAGQLEPGHYAILEREGSVRLTSAGRETVTRASRDLEGPWKHRKAREELMQQALSALFLYRRDMHYIVADGKIQIVDEFTGRPMQDRSWERGLHQLIEIKEGLEPSSRRETIARITYQRFFRRYLWLGAMTGTAAEVAPEVRSVLGLATVRIPAHRRVARRNLGERVFVSAAARWEAVVERITVLSHAGRAILVGTRSVAASERLSAMLADAGIEHALLNARQNAAEAAIIAAAGQAHRVTVATNMAGRGTDILLTPEVRAAGGLHVILTEFHESRRIDRQLFGRAGRQGDPGSHESLVSLEDALFATHAPWMTGRLRLHFAGATALPAGLGRALRVAAQASAERLHKRIRVQALHGEKDSDRLLAFAGRRE